MNELTLSAKLLVGVVRSGRGDRLAQIAREAGAAGGTILFGRGTGSSGFLNLLGLADIEKELVFIIAGNDVMTNIVHALENAPDLCRKIPGIGFVIDVTSFLRPSDAIMPHKIKQAEGEKVKESSHELICAVVNAGLADDIMRDARSAGARGGTILRARGTATGQDSGFFGIAIVPEKEFLMILVSRDQSDRIADAVTGAECLSEPGSGVVFRMPVEDFFQLGAKARKK